MYWVILLLVVLLGLWYVWTRWIVPALTKAVFKKVGQHHYKGLREQIRKEKEEYERQQQREQKGDDDDHHCYFPIEGDLVNWKHGLMGMGAVLELEFHPNPVSEFIEIYKPFKMCEIQYEFISKGVISFAQGNGGDIIEINIPKSPNCEEIVAGHKPQITTTLSKCFLVHSPTTDKTNPWIMKLYTRDPVIPDVIKQCGNTLHFKQGQRLK